MLSCCENLFLMRFITDFILLRSVVKPLMINFDKFQHYQQKTLLQKEEGKTDDKPCFIYFSFLPVNKYNNDSIIGTINSF